MPGIAALALALSGCGAANDSGSDESDSGSDSGDSGASLSGTLNGGGSSAQESAQGVWRAGFQSANPGVTVNYDPVGSGAGRENFISGAYVVRRLRLLPEPDEGELDAAKERCGGDADRGPGLRQPDRGHLQPRTVSTSSTSTPRRSPRSSTARSPSGTTRRSPPTTRTPTCRTPRSRPCTAPTTRAPPTTSPTTCPRPAGGAWTYDAGRRLADQGRRGRRGHLRCGRPRSRAARAPSATPTRARPATSASPRSRSATEFDAPSRRGCRARCVAASPRVEGRGDDDMAIDVDRTTTEAGAYPLLLASYLIACPTYDDAGHGRPGQGLPRPTSCRSEGQQAAADAGRLGAARLGAGRRGRRHRRRDQVRLQSHHSVRDAAGRPTGRLAAAAAPGT